VLDEVDDDESEDFADFNDDEDAPDPADEQRAMMASFEIARCDRVVQQFMATERQAHEEVRGMWQRGHQVADEDMYLMA
jgi:hypothetical protein